SDAMELTADKDVTITSCKERVVVNAKNEILLTAGGGYIRISGGNIEVHCPGTVTVKGASHSLNGPAQLKMPFPAMSLAEEQKTSKQISINQLMTNQLSGSNHSDSLKYTYIDPSNNKTLLTGTLSKTGETDRVYSELHQNLTLIVENVKEPWSVIKDHHYFAEDTDEDEVINLIDSHD
ncbi:DUF2345 domain-containing protein, partial [Chromobacterium sp. F49]